MDFKYTTEKSMDSTLLLIGEKSLNTQLRILPLNHTTTIKYGRRPSYRQKSVIILYGSMTQY